jgi:hypothetical protein
MMRWAILVVIFQIFSAIAWDVFAEGICHSTATFCQACRDINRDQNGLLALFSLALWIHIFLVCYLPASWRCP